MNCNESIFLNGLRNNFKNFKHSYNFASSFGKSDYVGKYTGKCNGC